ncbi:MAG: hypothetical protein EBY61_03510, partial [Actinobacteria bacterium]|nr:hypothetical protein [Actinomycetota bacterium]
VNKRAAEAWEDQAVARISADGLMTRAAANPYPTGQVPAGVSVLLMAVDTQDTWLEVSVWGYGRGEESWLVWHEKVQGDPSDLGPNGPWAQVDVIRQTQWPRDGGARRRRDDGAGRRNGRRECGRPHRRCRDPQGDLCAGSDDQHHRLTRATRPDASPGRMTVSTSPGVTPGGGVR